MCKAKHYIESLTKTLQEIDNYYNELTEEQSKRDKIENDLLHKIESLNFNASEGYEFARALKINRNKRRIIKNEYETLKELKHSTTSYLETLSNIYKSVENTELKLIQSKYHPRILKGNADLRLIV